MKGRKHFTKEKRAQRESTEKPSRAKKKKPIDIAKIREILPDVANVSRRRHLVQIVQSAAKKDRSKRRRARRQAERRGEEVHRETPKTIESKRPEDPTTVDAEDAAIIESDQLDEYAPFFSGKVAPKIMLGTVKKYPGNRLIYFLKELLYILPNSIFYKRDKESFKDLVKIALDANFTDILLINQRMKTPTGLYICHLPDGPTSYYRLTRLKLATEMKGAAATTLHNPEVILQNFTTRLGCRVSRQLRALFPLEPESFGRRLIYLHNSRDFIFFRHYRFVLREGEKVKCNIQEIGPRFSLKLRWIHKGLHVTPDTVFEFKWRPDLQVDRKIMFN